MGTAALAGFILTVVGVRDHVGGNEELKRRYGATVVGPAADRNRIPAIDVALAEGESWRLGSLEMRVIDVPGAQVIRPPDHVTLSWHSPDP